MVNVTSTPAILSAIELSQANPQGFAQPTVDLDLTSNGGTTWTNIASGVALDAWGNGSFAWTVPANLPPGNDYQLEVVSDNAPAVQAISAPFLVANSGDDYYVNGSSTSGGVFTTAAGNNAYSGTAPGQPMASLEALLNAYALGPGDVVYVDTANYTLLGNLNIPNGVTVIGTGGTAAILNRGNTNSGSYVFNVSGTTGVTLEDLGIAGAYAGVYSGSSAVSNQLTLNNDAFSGNYYSDVDAYGQQVAVQNSTFSSADYYAIDINGAEATVAGNTLTGNASANTYGIDVTGAGPVITNNTLENLPGYGIYLTSSGGGQVTNNMLENDDANGNSMYISGVSNGAAVQVAGNTVWSTTAATGRGIYADYGVAVGPATINGVAYGPNTVYGYSGSGGTGIAVVGNGVNATATGNVVYGNSTGIQVSYATASGNRVYDNSAYGIVAYYNNSQVLGNDVYSNGVGIAASGGTTAGVQVVNNLVYANTAGGIEVGQVASDDGTQVINNTVYQVAGNAVQVGGGAPNYYSAQNVSVRNNILWTQAGYDLDVTANSQQGFTSDYNLFNLGSGANLGFWNATENSLAEWQAASAKDAHSLYANPDFVDPNGADGILGYTTAGGDYNGGLDDNFSLAANSPAIHSGYSWATRRPISPVPRGSIIPGPPTPGHQTTLPPQPAHREATCLAPPVPPRAGTAAIRISRSACRLPSLSMAIRTPPSRFPPLASCSSPAAILPATTPLRRPSCSPTRGSPRCG